MRRLLAVACLLLLALAAPALAEERIASFVSSVTVNPDASLDVIETITVIVQNSSESTPRMLSGVVATWPPWKTSLSAYSGLVPMSP